MSPAGDTFQRFCRTEGQPQGKRWKGRRPGIARGLRRRGLTTADVLAPRRPWCPSVDVSEWHLPRFAVVRCFPNQYPSRHSFSACRPAFSLRASANSGFWVERLSSWHDIKLRRQSALPSPTVLLHQSHLDDSSQRSIRTSPISRRFSFALCPSPLRTASSHTSQNAVHTPTNIAGTSSRLTVPSSSIRAHRRDRTRDGAKTCWRHLGRVRLIKREGIRATGASLRKPEERTHCGT